MSCDTSGSHSGLGALHAGSSGVAKKPAAPRSASRREEQLVVARERDARLADRELLLAQRRRFVPHRGLRRGDLRRRGLGEGAHVRARDKALRLRNVVGPALRERRAQRAARRLS